MGPRHRIAVCTAVAACALAGVASVARGEPGNGVPEIEVLPSPVGVQYGQTVQVRGDDLPKGSGLIAATICGLTDDAGRSLPEPAASDCAGADELGTLVVLQENKDGTFDQPYTLPQSGQRFGENGRFCDATHHCALVVADANPDAPAYHVDQVLQFADQQPFGGTGGTPSSGGTTTTTAPPPPSASASASSVRVGESVDVVGERWNAADGDTTAGFVDAEGRRTTSPVAASIDDDGLLHVTLTAAFDDVDAAAILVEDPTSPGSTHRIVVPIDVEPAPGVSGSSSSEVQLTPEDPHLHLRARVIVAAPEGGAIPLPDQGGAGQLVGLVEQPAAACLALAPSAPDPQIVAACTQVVGAAAPATEPVRDAGGPLLAPLR